MHFAYACILIQVYLSCAVYCPIDNKSVFAHVMARGEQATKYRLCLYSLSGKIYFRKISWSLEAARFPFSLLYSLCKYGRHLGSAAAEVPVKLQTDTIIITQSPGWWPKSLVHVYATRLRWLNFEWCHTRRMSSDDLLCVFFSYFTHQRM